MIVKAKIYEQTYERDFMIIVQLIYIQYIV